MSGLLCIQPSLRQLALNVDRNPKLAIPGLQLRPKHSDLAAGAEKDTIGILMRPSHCTAQKNFRKIEMLV